MDGDHQLLGHLPSKVTIHAQYGHHGEPCSGKCHHGELVAFITVPSFVYLDQYHHLIYQAIAAAIVPQTPPKKT